MLYRILSFIFAPIFKLYYRPIIINNDKILKDGPLLLVGNHKHAFDPILVDCCTNRTIRTLAKSELFKGPFAFFFYAIKAIPVDLDAKNNPQALKTAIEHLKKGGIINLSPEAERNYTDKILLPFKKGAVKMSKATNTKILPYCIVGDYKFNSKNLKIVFGDYLTFENVDIETANEILFNNVKDLLIKNNEESIIS